MSKPATRGFDPISAILALATSCILIFVAYRIFAPAPIPPLPSVGMNAPLFQLLDQDTNEPMLWTPARGKITWLSFVGVKSDAELNALKELEKAWKQLETHSTSFAALAIIRDQGPVPQGLTLPMATARATTFETFASADTNGEMLHYLIDNEGKIVASARGVGGSLDKLLKQAKELLNDLHPVDRERYASL